MGRFKKIMVPPQWQEYWTAYPHGYTILEALVDWLSEFNDIVDFVNNVDEYLQTFKQRFDKELQSEVIKTLMEWQQSGFLDIIIDEALQTQIDELEDKLKTLSLNVKDFGVVGDGVTDDTQIIQNVINMAIQNGARSVFFPAGIYKITDTVFIDEGIKIFGEHRKAVIIKSELDEDKPLFAVAQNNSVSGLYLGSLIMNGNGIGTAIKLGAERDKSVVDSTFENIRVFNFKTGLHSTYSWCNNFRMVRFQACDKPLSLGSQTNATNFDSCSFVSYNTTISLTNCEGVTFHNCNIANMTDSDADMMTLYQSSLTIINPYFENVGRSLAQVGSSNEVIPSQLTIRGGLICKNVRLSGNNESIIIEGSRITGESDYKFYIENALSGIRFPIKNMFVNLDSQTMKLSKPICLVDYKGNRKPDFELVYYSDIPLVQELRRGYGVISYAGEGNGIAVANNLEVGEQYTLVYAVRKGTGFKYFISRMSGYMDFALPVNEQSEDFTIRYVPFIATDSRLRLLITGSIEVALLQLYKGIKNTDLAIEHYRIFYSDSQPTAGTWNKGDIVYNTNPANGTIGWVCTSSGTPGTWQQF